MKIILRVLSSFLAVFALVALARLLLVDLKAGFLPSGDQQRASAWALIMIGAAFILVQLASGAAARDRLKGILLGLAFILWGGEHYLPPGAPVIAVDFLVISIFVVDLGLMVRAQLAAEPASPKRR
jgi:hypothetical protein